MFKDPTTNTKSIMFTLLIVSSFLVCSHIVFDLFNIDNKSELAFNFFLSILTAYTTRKVSSNIIVNKVKTKDKEDV